MNYYECIQASIDYIENNLYEDIDLEKAADSAYMSLSNYYRLFFAIVGCSVKEYVRLRRIHLAAQDLYNHGFSRVKKFWHEIMITLEDPFTFQDHLVQEMIFTGEKYLTYDTNLHQLVASWQKVIQHVSANKIAGGRHQWVEEWKLENWSFPEKGITIFYPRAD